MSAPEETPPPPEETPPPPEETPPPPECNPRRMPEYKAEYLRQGRLFHAERARKKIERRLLHQAESAKRQQG